MGLIGDSCPAASSGVSEETMKATMMNTETIAVHYLTVHRLKYTACTCQSNKDQYHIPAVSIPFEVHVMEDGFLAPPEASVSMETWKQQHVHRHTHVKTDKCISCET